MTRPLSLGLRLTLLFAGIAALVFTLFGWFIVRAIEQHFASEDGRELRAVAQVVENSLPGLSTGEGQAHMRQHFADLLTGHHGIALRVVDATGGILYDSGGPWPDTPAAGGKIQTWQEGEHRYRVLQRSAAAPVAGSPFHIFITLAIDYHAHFLQHFHRTLWLMVAASIVIAGILGWLGVRQGHKPLRRISDQLHRIGAQALHTRLAPDRVPRELAELVSAFNALLQRLEQSFVRLAHFSDDIAHELRTPITVLMTQTQVALTQARSADQYREILYSSMEEYERLAQMVGDMLFLAKTGNLRVPPSDDEVDLAAQTRDLFDYYGMLAEDRQLTLTLDGEARARGDRLMLRRAIANLLSNAIRHTPPGRAVTVRLRQTAATAEVCVSNPGAAIAAEHLPHLFERFYRVDPSRQRDGEGTGLGLAIVKAIADAHGGRVGVRSDAQATEFSLAIPVSAPTVA